MEVDIVQLVGMIGVPGALCFVMMTKFQTALENNTKAIVAMTAIVQGAKTDGQ